MKLKYLLDTNCESCNARVVKEAQDMFYNFDPELPFEQQEFACGSILYYCQYVGKITSLGLCPKSEKGIRQVELRRELMAKIEECIGESNVDRRFKSELETALNIDVTNLKSPYANS